MIITLIIKIANQILNIITIMIMIMTMITITTMIYMKTPTMSIRISIMDMDWNIEEEWVDANTCIMLENTRQFPLIQNIFLILFMINTDIFPNHFRIPRSYTLMDFK